MAEKRPHPGNNKSINGVKRLRSTPEPTTTSNNGVKTAPANIQEQIAAAKARAAAAVRDRMAGAKPASPAPVAVTAASSLSPAEAARKKLEEMKARVAAATARAGSSAPQRTTAPTPTYQPPQHDEGPSKARGGLGIGLHPALMGDVGQEGRSSNKASVTSKFSTTIGNRRTDSAFDRISGAAKLKNKLDLRGPDVEELKQNPFYDASLGGPTAASRKSRDLVFNQKGKFIAQAAALRRQAQLEEMKKRIADSARKAGLEDDRTEQALAVPQPPEVEWWDEGLVNGSSYPDPEDISTAMEQKLKITSEDSVITRYVQHPVLLQPPQEKTIPPPKPMYMTKEEQAKKRRQDRKERQQEKQAKIRLGLEPADPPKVKKSNLMRVLGEQAVKDPTAVEARVNREIAERQEKHEEANAERKLTNEERLKKLETNQEKDAAKGLIVNVYRIDSLAYGKHRYQVDINAKQNALTGITILNPKMNLVIIEGGQHSVKSYNKLMLSRIKWTDIAPSIDNSDRRIHPSDRDIEEASWLKSEEESGELRDMTENRCVLVWEGEVKQRAFKKWGSKVCATEGEARRTLEKFKMEHMWTAAKSMSSS